MIGINAQVSAWTAIATLPIFLWELSVGLWMTFKGFDPSAGLLAQPTTDVGIPFGVELPGSVDHLML
jgi:hypothetical protein